MAWATVHFKPLFLPRQVRTASVCRRLAEKVRASVVRQIQQSADGIRPKRLKRFNKPLKRFSTPLAIHPSLAENIEHFSVIHPSDCFSACCGLPRCCVGSLDGSRGERLVLVGFASCCGRRSRGCFCIPCEQCVAACSHRSSIRRLRALRPASAGLPCSPPLKKETHPERRGALSWRTMPGRLTLPWRQAPCRPR